MGQTYNNILNNLNNLNYLFKVLSNDLLEFFPLG